MEPSVRSGEERSEQLIGDITIRSRWQSAGERDRRPPCEYAK